MTVAIHDTIFVGVRMFEFGSLRRGIQQIVIDNNLAGKESVYLWKAARTKPYLRYMIIWSSGYCC